jgi:adenylyl-sulfate kinase
LLDGDVTRRHLSPDLGYTREDRDLHVARLGWLASRLTRQGAAVVVAAISPYEAARATARRAVEEHGTFVEVWVRATIEECARRDVKGLYARALAGEIGSFTGVSDPYESPKRPDLLLDTELQSPTASLERVIADLEHRSLV